MIAKTSAWRAENDILCENSKEANSSAHRRNGKSPVKPLPTATYRIRLPPLLVLASLHGEGPTLFARSQGRGGRQTVGLFDGQLRFKLTDKKTKNGSGKFPHHLLVTFFDSLVHHLEVPCSLFCCKDLLWPRQYMMGNGPCLRFAKSI